MAYRVTAVGVCALAVMLVPNAGGTPGGTSYNVRYYQSGGVFFEETWVVPSSYPLATPAGCSYGRSSGSRRARWFRFPMKRAKRVTPMAPLSTRSAALLNAAVSTGAVPP